MSIAIKDTIEMFWQGREDDAVCPITLTLSAAKYQPGCYALQIEARLPKEVVRRLNAQGIPFRNSHLYQ